MLYRLEEYYIRQGVVINIFTLLQSRKTSNTPMALTVAYII